MGIDDSGAEGITTRAAAMERELIGAGIQLISMAMNITGITIQRRAMMADEHEDDFVLVHSPVPPHHPSNNADDQEEEGDADGEHYGTFESSGGRLNEEYTVEFEKHKAGGKRCHRCRVACRQLRNVSKMWLLGFATYYASQVVEIFALSFASQSTLVAVGSLGGFINALVAVKIFHETFQFAPPKSEPTILKKIFHWDLLNLFIMVCGSVLTVLFAPILPREEEKSFDAAKLLHKWIEVPFVFFFVTGVTLAAILAYRFFFIKRGPLTLAYVLGFFASISITMSKVVTELVDGNHLFTLQALAMILIWVGVLISQIILLQIGLRNFEQSGTFSVSGVLGGALTITSGMLYYQTYENFDSEESRIGFSCGVALLLYGILVFSQRKNVSKAEMRRRLLADAALLEEEESRRAAAMGLERANLVLDDAEIGQDAVQNSAAPLERPLLG